jgi:hypothetical protein
MLRQTASTTRAGMLLGRACRSDMNAAPGMKRMVTTPGNGVIGEWTALSNIDVTRAAANQIPVGVIRRPKSFAVDQSIGFIRRG